MHGLHRVARAGQARREYPARPGEGRGAEAERRQATRPPLNKGDRISIYWTEMDTWFTATHVSTRKAQDDNGDTIYESHVLYDAVGTWRRRQDLSYWHCLADEQWTKEQE